MLQILRRLPAPLQAPRTTSLLYESWLLLDPPEYSRVDSFYVGIRRVATVWVRPYGSKCYAAAPAMPQVYGACHCAAVVLRVRNNDNDLAPIDVGWHLGHGCSRAARRRMIT